MAGRARPRHKARSEDVCGALHFGRLHAAPEDRQRQLWRRVEGHKEAGHADIRPEGDRPAWHEQDGAAATAISRSGPACSACTSWTACIMMQKFAHGSDPWLLPLAVCLHAVGDAGKEQQLRGQPACTGSSMRAAAAARLYSPCCHPRPVARMRADLATLARTAAAPCCAWAAPLNTGQSVWLRSRQVP